MKKFEVPSDILLKLLQGAYIAIDGLWFMGVENKYNFDEALEIDIDVWKNWMKILPKRIKKLLNMEGNDIPTIVKILEIAYQMEGTDYEVTECNDERAVIRILKCHWYENLKKAGREKLLPCVELDKDLYPPMIEKINPNVSFKQVSGIPEGDESCDFILELKK